MPAAASSRSGSPSPSRSIPSVITVDSPPGMTSASSPSSSPGTAPLGPWPEAAQHPRVGLEVALQREDADQRRAAAPPSAPARLPAARGQQLL